MRSYMPLEEFRIRFKVVDPDGLTASEPLRDFDYFIEKAYGEADH